MTRKYYTLCEKRPGGQWAPEFGDYDRAVVEQEQRDTGFELGTEFKIIVTDSSQTAINRAVGELNGEKEAEVSRRNEAISAAQKGIREYLRTTRGFRLFGTRATVIHTERGFAIHHGPDNSLCMTFDCTEF